MSRQTVFDFLRRPAAFFLAALALQGAPAVAAAEAPPPLPAGYTWAASGYAGPAGAALTHTGGKWRPVASRQGRYSPWAGLVIKKSAANKVGKKDRLSPTAFSEVLAAPRAQGADVALFPALARPAGWVLLRNPSPVALTPALIARWDNFFTPNHLKLEAVLAKTGKAINPNQPLWPSGALLWLKAGEPDGPAPDKQLHATPLDPLTGFAPATGKAKKQPPCQHLRLAVDLEALTNPTGVPQADHTQTLCEALDVLAAHKFPLLGLPPRNPQAGRYGQALTTSVLLPPGAGPGHATVARFGPAFAAGEGRWVLATPVATFWWRDSLEQAGLPPPPLPDPAPDGPFFTVGPWGAGGVTLSFYQRGGHCEVACLYEAVCHVRLARGRLIARAGSCEREF